MLVFHDSMDWGRDIQLVLDLVSAEKGVFGTHKDVKDPSLWTAENQLPVYFSNPDMLWGNEWSQPRFGQGALQTSIASVFKEVTGYDLHRFVYSSLSLMRVGSSRPLSAVPRAANQARLPTTTPHRSSSRRSKPHGKATRTSICTARRIRRSTDASTWSATILPRTLQAPTASAGSQSSSERASSEARTRMMRLIGLQSFSLMYW